MPPVLYATRAADLKARLEGVGGAGIVHTRQRFTAQWSQFLALFKDADGRVRGWEVSAGPRSPEQAPDWIETWELAHYLGLNDAEATELDFQAHLEAVARSLRDGPYLPDEAAPWGVVTQGMSIDVAETRSFGGVLCHYGQCTLSVRRHYDEL